MCLTPSTPGSLGGGVSPRALPLLARHGPLYLPLWLLRLCFWGQKVTVLCVCTRVLTYSARVQCGSMRRRGKPQHPQTCGPCTPWGLWGLRRCCLPATPPAPQDGGPRLPQGFGEACHRALRSGLFPQGWSQMTREAGSKLTLFLLSSPFYVRKSFRRKKASSRKL